MAEPSIDDKDDIFASFGSTLLKDLMADLSNLDSLESALDDHERATATAPGPTDVDRRNSDLFGSSFPLKARSGVESADFSSAASVVVSHQAQRHAQEMFFSGSSSDNNVAARSANGVSLLNFDSMAAHEFLLADSAKKKQLHELPSGMTENTRRLDSKDSEDNDGVDTAAAQKLVHSLLLDDEEEYDVDEEPSLAAAQLTLLQPPHPSLVAPPASVVPEPRQDLAPTKDVAGQTKEAAKSLLTMLQKPTQPQGQMTMPFTPSFHMMTPSGHVLPVVPPPGAAPVGGIPFPSQPRVMVPLPPHGMPIPPPHRLMPPIVMQPPPKQQGSQFTQADFPTLGTQPHSASGKDLTTVNVPSVSEPKQPLPGHHILFNNPHITRAPPIPANLVASSLMTSRDILYVVHTMLRPLLPLVEDPYHYDYYFQLFTERQTRGIALAERPAWKNEKEQIAGKELHFRQVVVERARDWKEDKQTLGHVVKSDVKRPRALLATPVLSKMASDGGVVGEVAVDEHSQRAQLWKARALVDTGYQAYLELVEARRLLATNLSQERQEELAQDVARNIGLLHGSFGFCDGDKVSVDVSILHASLMLPKGQELLARCMEGGILPHTSACVLLPHIICTSFCSARPATTSEVVIAKEERLCRSLTALVLLRNPSVSKEHLMLSLDGIMKVAVDTNTSLKKLLAHKARVEVMHAVLSRGGEIFKSDASEEDAARWRRKEAEFIRLLSSA